MIIKVSQHSLYLNPTKSPFIISMKSEHHQNANLSSYQHASPNSMTRKNIHKSVLQIHIHRGVFYFALFSHIWPQALFIKDSLGTISSTSNTAGAPCCGLKFRPNCLFESHSNPPKGY